MADEPRTEPRTERGRRARERIVVAAAGLFERQGVEATGLDQVLGAAGASKSQLYHYFTDKHELVRAVIAWQTTTMVDGMAPRLARVRQWADLDQWFSELVEYHRLHNCEIGCPIGTLAAELADTDEPARQDLAEAFAQWETQLRGVLDVLCRNGLLAATADTAQLAAATLAAIQGGLLMAKTTRDPDRLRFALDAAGTYLRSFAP